MLRRRQANRGKTAAASNQTQTEAATTEQIVEERIKAFTPFPLPSLVNDHYYEYYNVFPSDEGSGSAKPPKIRITHLLMMLYLHVGHEPPDCPRVEPCARLECWVDPMVAQVSHFSPQGSRGTGSEGIAEALEKQYRSSILRDKDINVFRVVENSIDSARSALAKSRRLARNGRLVVHYNGHGMPQATEQGEIWMFNKERSHYVPLHILVMAELLDSPTLYVFDCNGAGSMLQGWYNGHMQEERPHDLFICACGPGEMLPLSPALPADMLTACLTTPLRMALEWYIGFSHHKVILPQISDEMIRCIPGSIMDLNTPLGELHWILTAITESVAWCTMPQEQFQSLFRQDGATASMFRNAILADRLLRGAGCTPMTHPPLSEEAHRHPLWELWVYSLERVISQLPSILPPHTTDGYIRSTFFVDQIVAFDIWIESGDLNQIPEQLPSVLFALYQPSYHVKVFLLLIKYLDSCKAAGNYAIKGGLLQYLGGFTVKCPELLLLVTLLWMQAIRADPTRGCAELQQYQGEKYLINLLKLDGSNIHFIDVGEGLPTGEEPSAVPPLSKQKTESRGSSTLGSPTTTQPPKAEKERNAYYRLKGCDVDRCKSTACYVLCQFLLRGEKQCILCWNNRILNAAFPCLSADSPELVSWTCLLLSKLFSGLRHAKRFAAKECTSRLTLFTPLLESRSPIVRSSCVTLLASVVGSRVDLMPEDQQLRFLQMEKTLLIKLRGFLFDASVNVREEIIFFCCQLLYHYNGCLPPRYRSVTAIQEFVADVGRPSPSWVLEEPDVGIKSQLHAARPTVNAYFDDTVVFETVFLTSDDPPPSTPDIDPEALSPAAKTIMEGLLHDAAQMLCVLSYNCDTALVTAALKRMTNGGAPVSQRFAFEAFRNMCSVNSVIVTLTEADRTRATTNADLMRQVVLEMKTKKMDYTRYSDPNGGVEAPSSGAEGDRDPWSVGATSLTSAAKYQIISSCIQSDSVVCADFRALDASIVVATKKQKVYYISYDSYSSQEVANSFQLRLTGPVHDIKVINDLSEQSGILVVNKKGGFNLLKNCWSSEQSPVEAAVFSACPPEDRWIDLKSTYRSSEATLFYGGPIGEGGETQIHALSLAAEQVTQSIAVPGSASLTALTGNTAQRALLAGFSDTVVRYYDDRQGQGQVGMVGVLQCGQGLTHAEPILGVGALASGTGNYVVAGTRSVVRVFDIRRMREPLSSFTGEALHGPARDPSVTPFMTNCSVGLHTGVIGISFNNNTYAAYSSKGQILNDRPIPVSTYASPPLDPSTMQPVTLQPLLPKSCITHPLRPLMSFGCDLMILQP